MFLSNPFWSAKPKIVVGSGNIFMQATNTNSLYNLDANVITGSTAANPGYTTVMGGGDGAGSGWLMGGRNNSNQSVTTNRKYSFASDSTTNMTALTVAMSQGGCTGNSTQFLMYSGQYNTGTSGAPSIIYLYASNTYAGGAAAARLAVNGPGAAGNATIGVFAGRSGTSPNTDIYTYASNTTSGGTSTGLANAYMSGAGNTTDGYFGLGVTATTTLPPNVAVYNYAGNTVRAGSNLTYGGQTAAAAGTATGSAWLGGSTTGPAIRTTALYRYSDDAVSSGTALQQPDQGMCAVSDNPGNF